MRSENLSEKNSGENRGFTGDGTESHPYRSYSSSLEEGIEKMARDPEILVHLQNEAIYVDSNFGFMQQISFFVKEIKHGEKSVSQERVVRVQVDPFSGREDRFTNIDYLKTCAALASETQDQFAKALQAKSYSVNEHTFLAGVRD